VVAVVVHVLSSSEEPVLSILDDEVEVSISYAESEETVCRVSIEPQANVCFANLECDLLFSHGAGGEARTRDI
jgi:hypothetical protein